MSRLRGSSTESWGWRLARVVTAVGFVGAGILHFTMPGPYERIVPNQLPNPELLVAVSGVAEILGGIGLLVPAMRRAAGWGLVALLVAVLPANVNMAVRSEQFADVAPAWALWARLPLQAALIVLVLRVSAPRANPKRRRTSPRLH